MMDARRESEEEKKWYSVLVMIEEESHVAQLAL